MIYEHLGKYEIMEWATSGECGVWFYPGAMDEVNPIIVLPTVEAARIWVSKQLAAAQNRDTGWPQYDLNELGFSAMGLIPATEAARAGGDDSGYSELLDKLSAQIKRLERENKHLKEALEPFAEAWLQVPYGLRSTLRIWNGLLDDESRDVSIGISTDTLQDAHTAYFNLPKTNATG